MQDRQTAAAHDAADQSANDNENIAHDVSAGDRNAAAAQDAADKAARVEGLKQASGMAEVRRRSSGQVVSVSVLTATKPPNPGPDLQSVSQAI